MMKYKLLFNTILFTIILFLFVPVVFGVEGVCPNCGGSVLPPPFLDPNQDVGCCESSIGMGQFTLTDCVAPMYRSVCKQYNGSFVKGVMSCDPKHKCEKSNAIHLSSFSVTQQDGTIFVYWTTGAEIDTEGFHILRSTSSAGPYSRITPSMIASTGSGFSGGRYSYLDTAVEEGKSYYYKLEEVDVYGKLAQYGPIAVDDRSKKLEARSQITEDEKSEVRNDISEESGQRTPPPHPSPLKGEGEVEDKVRTTYTIVAFADGPVKFLSGEAADAERVAGIIREEADEQMLEAESQISEVRGKKSVVTSQNEEKVENSSDESAANKEIASGTPRNDSQSPESIQFRIIDAEGNEVAIASVDETSEVRSKKSEARSKKLEKEKEDGLQYKWNDDLIVLTWYASQPIKGFHILRSAKKDGEYQKITKAPIPYLNTGQEGKIFKYNYVDTKVEKGKEYFYKIEIIKNIENKTAMKK